MPLTDITSRVSGLLPAGMVLRTGKIHQYQRPLAREEEQLIQEAQPHRLREFTAGRAIAKEAMQHLGVESVPIGRSEDGCPLWPPSVVGSISHKGGLCGAIVADSTFCAAVGFDIEFMEHLDRDVWKTFASEEEISQAALCDMEKSCFANILFSAKEAHFKALYPLLGQQAPSLAKITLLVKNHNNHIVTSFAGNGVSTCGGIVCGPQASLAWALSKKNV